MEVKRKSGAVSLSKEKLEVDPMFTQAAPMTAILTGAGAGEEQKVAAVEAVKVQYSCKKCRKVLFSDDNLEEHMSKIKAYNTRAHSLRVSP